MPVNLTGPRMRPASLPGRPLQTHPSVAPQFGFFAVVLLAFGLWIALRAASPDLAMPLVATLFLGFAATFAGIAWWRGAMDPNRVTYRDVAGALTLIGVCAAAAIDSDQMIRIVQASNNE